MILNVLLIKNSLVIKLCFDPDLDRFLNTNDSYVANSKFLSELLEKYEEIKKPDKLEDKENRFFYDEITKRIEPMKDKIYNLHKIWSSAYGIPIGFTKLSLNENIVPILNFYKDLMEIQETPSATSSEICLIIYLALHVKIS